MLGDWVVHGDFQSAIPFPHVVIDNVFSEDVVQGLLAEFGSPPDDTRWKRYWNPIEKKYALNDLSSRPFTKSVFDFLQHDDFVKKVSAITAIPTLQSDPHLHGAGLHYHPRGGKLDMHLDYSIHPISGLERRVNLIVYLNETWESAWGGSLELWDSDFTHCVESVLPTRNRGVLFQTSDISYHGVPKPIECPESTGRKSLAVYYVSPVEHNTKQRFKAEFRPLPTQLVDERLRALYSLRGTRLLTPEDLWETWDADGNGVW